MAIVKTLIGNVKGNPGNNGKDGSENQIYSYNETVIGTWVNGKPIYRKAFNYTNSGTPSKIVDLSSLKIDTICDIYGSHLFADAGTQFQCCLNVAYGNTKYSAPYYNISTKSLELNVNYACSGVIIIEYTKTTD